MSQKLISVVFVLLTGFYGFGQHAVCLGDDISVCVGSNVQIDNCGGVTLPGGSSIVLDNPNSVSLTDDSWSGAINLGFTFNFYGSNYTQCRIGSNGLITFNNNTGFNSWSLTTVGTLPSTTFDDAKNSVMVAYSDINPNSGGNIYYATVGTAPNRQFYVVYANIPMFNATDCNYMVIVLSEGTNEIELHVSNKTVNAGWNGGLAIQGVQNAAGTVATTTPGRNNTQWTANNDAKLFKPTSPTNTNAYTVSNIPFKLFLSGGANFSWQNTNGANFPYNNGVLNVNNVQAGPPVGYFLTVAGSNCQSQVGAISDTTFITALSSSVTASATPDMCSAGIGSVTATPTSGPAPHSFNWPGLGNATTQTVNNVSAGTYLVQMTDGHGCVSASSVTVGDTPANYTSSITKVSCPGGSDGTATVEMVPALGNITYQWNDPNNQTTAKATGLAAGTYECVITSDVGCANTISVDVTEIPGMQVQVTNRVDATCNSGNDGVATIAVNQGTAPYTYSWTGSNSTAATANDLGFGTTTVTITDDKGCVVTEDINIDQPTALTIAEMSQDTIICIGDSVQLFAVGAGGSSDYIYTWTLNGQVVGTEDTIYVTPTAALTEYCLTLTEQCGSPAANACLIVSYPNEVDPTLSPDKTGECFPIEVVFDNTTNTLETIDYTVWRYSDGDSDTLPGSNPATHEFGKGIFDVEIEIVTNRGCSYVKKYPNLIEGYPFPKANFYINPNPASIFEPKVDVFSQSGNDIISYEWFAEDANPNYSSIQNPTFKYPAEIRNYPLLLVVENSYGCIDSLQKLVRIENEVLLFSPNSFTPDGNGFNDKWKVHISGVDIYNYHLEVFNRWGEKVFESFDPEGYWDGTYGGRVAPDGTYIWKITALDFETDARYEFKGSVNILK